MHPSIAGAQRQKGLHHTGAAEEQKDENHRKRAVRWRQTSVDRRGRRPARDTELPRKTKSRWQARSVRCGHAVPSPPNEDGQLAESWLHSIFPPKLGIMRLSME